MLQALNCSKDQHGKTSFNLRIGFTENALTNVISTRKKDPNMSVDSIVYFIRRRKNEKEIVQKYEFYM